MRQDESHWVNGKRVAAAEGASSREVRPTDNTTDAVDLWTAWAANSGPQLVRLMHRTWSKRALDLVFAVLLLIPSVPLIGVLVVLVRLTSRGPGIFRQLRVGLHGRTFWMYKIRTMRLDAEAGHRAIWAKKDDPRVTRVGKVLRNLHLDELPQLFNVLRGDMSLIGPRPERPEFVHVLAKRIPGYLNRLAVRPGVTGLAQVNLEPDTDAESVRQKLALDIEYIRGGYLWMDARLLSCTLIHLLGISGERSTRLMGLHREVGQSQETTVPDHEAATVPYTSATLSVLALETAASGNGKVSSNGKPLNAFTVDVEDYFHVASFERHIRRIEWESFTPRIEASTRRLLALLDRHGVKATFFVLGWVARRHPRLVREIHDAGHEIGSHGYWHRRIFEQTPKEFRRDLRDSRDVLTDIISDAVVAYRAPTFSITNKSLWALHVLAEEGFTVDSSIYPVRHDRYGIAGARTNIHQLETRFGRIVECPPAVVRCGRLRVPAGGGGYFRLYPFGVTRRCLKNINQRRQQPFVFYVHPWEVDADQPRLDVGSWTSRFRHRVNLSGTERKLDELFENFRFGRICDVIQETGFDAAGSVEIEEYELPEVAVEE